PAARSVLAAPEPPSTATAIVLTAAPPVVPSTPQASPPAPMRAPTAGPPSSAEAAPAVETPAIPAPSPQAVQPVAMQPASVRPRPAPSASTAAPQPVARADDVVCAQCGARS